MTTLTNFLDQWQKDAIQAVAPQVAWCPVCETRETRKAFTPKVQTMRVYIAAPYQMREAGIALRDLLGKFTIGCTSRWLDQPMEVRSDEWARNDLADVMCCDALVAVNPREWKSSGTGGRHVEFGYALGLRKPIILFGEKSNIFHEISDVIVVEDFDALAEALISRERLLA